MSVFWLLSILPFCVSGWERIIVQCHGCGYLSSLIYLLVATVYRFRWAGRICSGEYVQLYEVIEEQEIVMTNIGKFIKWTIIVWWCMIPVVLIFKAFEHRLFSRRRSS